MIPIPKYLKPYAELKKGKNYTTAVFSMKCSCGNEVFNVLVNYLTPDEKKALQLYYDIINQLTGPFTKRGEDGNPEVLWRTEDGEMVSYESLQPLKPYYAGINVLKAKCPVCGEEILLFDNRICGYDGVTEEHTEERMSYEPHFKQKGKTSIKIEITIENDPSLDAFKDATGIDCKEDFYSEAFSWIVIHGIDPTGKKKKIYENETA